MRANIFHSIVFLIALYFCSCQGGHCERDEASDESFQMSVYTGTSQVTFDTTTLIAPVKRQVLVNNIPLSYNHDNVSLRVVKGGNVDTVRFAYTRNMVEGLCGWKMRVRNLRVDATTLDSSHKVNAWVNSSY